MDIWSSLSIRRAFLHYVPSICQSSLTVWYINFYFYQILTYQGVLKWNFFGFLFALYLLCYNSYFIFFALLNPDWSTGSPMPLVMLLDLFNFIFLASKHRNKCYFCYKKKERKKKRKGIVNEQVCHQSFVSHI
jgi:hypothetical protein